MSRHSKNNTASAIFTYGERTKLQEWGTLTARVGKDSQKQFDQCELCLGKVMDPMCCRKGHIFCKMCIIENLVQQRKEKEIQQKRYQWNQEEKSKNQKSDQQKKLVNQVEEFEKVEMNLPQAKQTAKDFKYDGLEEEHKDKLQFAEEWQVNKNAPNAPRHEAKKEWIKASFWAPENTPLVKEEEVAPPSKKLECPAQDLDHSHHIKLKELVNLKLEENELHQYICWICQKSLTHQKISALRKCGHVMCLKCITNFVLKDGGKCTQCDTKVDATKDVVDLKESGSAFASHNKVEAKVYKPAFQS